MYYRPYVTSSNEAKTTVIFLLAGLHVASELLTVGLKCDVYGVSIQL